MPEFTRFKVKAASELDPDKALATINRFLQGKPFLRAWKAEKVLAMFPRDSGVEIEKWQQHFKWSEDGTQIIGRTACGRATVIALRLNNAIAVMVRREWVAAGWHPPKE